MTTVARGLSPRYRELSDSLAPTVNPKGWGVVVFVGSDVDCRAKYAWLWVHADRVYAVDRASNEVAPGWPLLDDATADEWNGFGFDRANSSEVLRNQVCAARN